LKLGKKAKRSDPRTLRLAKYTMHLPIPPDLRDWGGRVKNWEVFLNDKIGDCAVAAPAHQIMGWTACSTGTPAGITDDQILAAYSAISGYKPDQPETDTGCVMLDVLNYWRKTGIAGHKAMAYAEVHPTDVLNIQRAINMFGSVYLGFALPLSAQSSDSWNVVDPSMKGDAAPGSWGGHAVEACRYSPTGITVITWGQKMEVSWPFLFAYSDEAYCVLSQDWIEKTGSAPSGFDMATLKSDLAAVTA